MKLWTTESLDTQFHQWIEKKRITRLIEAMWLFIQIGVPAHILDAWMKKHTRNKGGK